jgi:hypothetical protein
MEIGLNRFNRLVPQPERDYGNIHAVLENAHGKRVAAMPLAA